MNPMMIPFVMYQRWLEMVLLPLAKAPTKVTFKLVPKPTPYEG